MDIRHAATAGSRNCLSVNAVRPLISTIAEDAFQARHRDFGELAGDDDDPERLRRPEGDAISEREPAHRLATAFPDPGVVRVGGSASAPSREAECAEARNAPEQRRALGDVVERRRERIARRARRPRPDPSCCRRRPPPSTPPDRVRRAVAADSSSSRGLSRATAASVRETMTWPPSLAPRVACRHESHLTKSRVRCCSNLAGGDVG